MPKGTFVFLKRYKALIKKEKGGMLLTPKMQEMVRRNQEIIIDFLGAKNVPAWFRGLSHFQTQAVNRLFTSLRDDTEQNTTYRVYNCLKLLGLHPMVNPKQLTVIMKYAAKNDIALLWFLWESFYKSTAHGYTISEQLLLSAIMHLDLITTLRRLDNVLPPGQKPKRVLELQRKNEGKPKARRLKKQNKPEASHVLPYFIEQRLPHKFGKSLEVTRPDLTVSLDFYENYKDPYFVVPNESTCWYAAYKLNPSRRIALHIIKREINKLSLNSVLHESLTDIITQAVTEAVTEPQTNIGSMCEHHKVAEEMAKIKALEERVAAVERCNRYFDLERDQKQRAKLRVREQLEREINSHLNQTKLEEDNCLMMLCGKEGLHLLKAKHCEGNATHPEAKTILEEECDISQKKRKWVQKNKTKDDCNKTDCKCISCVLDKKLQTGVVKGSGGKHTITKALSHTSAIARRGEEDLKRYEKLSPSQLYFRATDKNQPYMFDYNKIFDFTEKKRCCDIKENFIRALHSEMNLSVKSEDLKAEIATIVAKCAQEIWRNDVELENIEITKRMLQKEREDNLKNPILRKYNQKYFDPDDKKLMVNMLKDALEYIAEDTKYVLASMPDVYKLPILQEWIMRRYGKVYSAKECYKSIHICSKLLDTLNRLRRRPRLLPHQLAVNQKIKYSYRDCLLHKFGHLKRQLYNKFNNEIMEYTRLFWEAMRVYLCTSGPPWRTFYAYMPPRVQNIAHFRPAG